MPQNAASNGAGAGDMESAYSAGAAGHIRPRDEVEVPVPGKDSASGHALFALYIQVGPATDVIW